ncbi:MAG: PBECR2 nuclease fold domain-containing protein [Patescibacteria group bacterium]
MPQPDFIFRVTDYRGKIVIFTKAKWEEKQSDHPELHKQAFLDCLKKTIIQPEEVWEDYSDKKKRCYYRKYSSSTYAKVVVWMNGNPYHVVTAYEIDGIKEKKYPNLKQFI